MIEAINGRMQNSLAKDVLESTFEKWWSDFGTAIENLPASTAQQPSPPQRNERELLEEVLEHVRRISARKTRVIDRGTVSFEAIEDMASFIARERHLGTLEEDIDTWLDVTFPDAPPAAIEWAKKIAERKMKRTLGRPEV